jgi:peptidoglycan hydrolase CwlO-like protein
MTTHPTPEAPAWPVSAMSRIMLESLAEAQADSLRTLSAELAQAKTDLHIATDDAAQMLASTQALSAELAAARAQCAGHLDQHHRDSAELRRLCQARDDETKARKQAKEALYAERDRATAAVKAEQQKHSTTIAERDSLRAEVERLRTGIIEPKDHP